MIVIIDRQVYTPVYIIQWSLRIKDTLGPAILSTIESCPLLGGLREMIILGHYSSREAVLFSEGPLSEVPLYLQEKG